MYLSLSLQIEKIEDTNMCVEFPLQEMQGREEEQKIGVDFHSCWYSVMLDWDAVNRAELGSS